MKTENVTVGDATYIIAPLNFDQYEAHFFTQDGDPSAKPKVGAAVRDSIANAASDANPPYQQIPAGHVMKLISKVMTLSGLEVAQEQTEGEATAAATA